MAPAGKHNAEMQGPSPTRPLLECALSQDVDLTPVLPWTAAKSNKHGQTLFWPDAIAKQPVSKAVYPLFHHSFFAGLVPTFSSFCTPILNHYGIQALLLQPNSILLLSVFAFYLETSVGVRPSVALFRHFYSMRLHGAAHLSPCVCFVMAHGGNLLQKAGKKAENFWHRWVLMSLKEANPRQEVPKRLPEKTSAWSSVKLSDPQVAPVLERFSRDIIAKRLTHGMIVKEFLAPLQAHSRPLWSEDLPTKELRRVVATLLGSDPSDLPEVLGPLYHLNDQADLIAVLPIFDERGLFMADGSGLVEEACQGLLDEAPLALDEAEKGASHAALILLQIPVTGLEAQHASKHERCDDNGWTFNAHTATHNQHQVGPRQPGAAR
ncbi:hypothetical protein D1007_20678 [Hordeum vulgare]|nr:hypothetical protein D1007_20678 [Hordeum vulgare]